MKLSVDRGRCMGHGRCYATAPTLLSYDDDGYVSIRGEVLEVPDGELGAALDAAANCPEQAIKVGDA